MSKEDNRQKKSNFYEVGMLLLNWAKNYTWNYIIEIIKIELDDFYVSR